MVWSSCPKSWTLDIQPWPTEQLDWIIQIEAAAFEQLEFVVEPFDETVGMPTLEIAENPILPVVQGVDETVKTTQAGRLDLFDPELESGLSSRPIWAVIEDRRQQRAQHVGTGQSQGLLEQRHHLLLLVGIQGSPFPAEQGSQLGGGHFSIERPIGVEPTVFGLA